MTSKNPWVILQKFKNKLASYINLWSSDFGMKDCHNLSINHKNINIVIIAANIIYFT